MWMDVFKIPIKYGFQCHLVAWFNIQVVKLDLQEVCCILDIEEIFSAEAQRNPRGDHRQQVLQHRPIERQGQTAFLYLLICP